MRCHPAVELFKGGDLHQPATELAAALKTDAARRGLLLLTCGNYNNAIRVMVPLTIPFALLEEGLAIFDAALAAVCGGD